MFTSLDSPLTLLGTHTKYNGALFSVEKKKKESASDGAWGGHLSQRLTVVQINKSNLVLYILI